MGIIFDIQKFSVHDGPGIRTTVFLKGCNIRCLWCHNPESFIINSQLAFEQSRCSGCRRCESVCAHGVHLFVNEKHEVNYELCKKCGKCIEECPNHCLKIFGYDMTAKEVIKEVLKDKKYYESSGGGITISGGEPSVQYDFLMELLIESKNNELHTCIETNGIIEFERLKEIAKYVDLFLLDYKATGFERHKLLTGCSNEQMLNNLDYLSSIEKAVVLRCPIIPGLNDTEEHFSAIKEIKEMYSNIKEVEIMSYHSLGKSKWDSIGKDYSLKDIKDVDSKKKIEWEMKIK